MAKNKNPEDSSEGVPAPARGRAAQTIQQVTERAVAMTAPDRSTLRGIMHDNYEARGYMKRIRLLEECPYPDNSLDLFLLSSYFGYGGDLPGLVGTLKTDPSRYQALHQRIADRLKKLAASEAIPFDVISRLGATSPFPLLHLETAFDAMKAQDEAGYAELLTTGVLKAGQFFVPRLTAQEYFMVIADINALGPVSDTRACRFLMNGLNAGGIHTLCVYQEDESLTSCLIGDVFGSAAVVPLGRFS